jgi:hypothetical protein
MSSVWASAKGIDDKATAKVISQNVQGGLSVSEELGEGRKDHPVMRRWISTLS